MKILTTDQIRQADEYTIRNEPVSSVNLMERAAKAVADWITDNIPEERKFKIFAGPGNNGGDGLALTRMLTEKGITAEIFLLASRSGYSPDASVNLERLRAMNISPSVIGSEKDFPFIEPSDIVVDALFGTGLTRPLSGLPGRLIDSLNESGAEIVSIDIPSGLFGDDNRENSGGSIIRAKQTLSFQFPKLAFFFAENEKYVGHWEILPIGLHKKFIDELKTGYYYTGPDLVRSLLKTRSRFAHKGSFGHCLLISGSYGKMGAAVLGATACLRSGAGLLTVHVPAKGCEIVQTGIPEAMISIDSSDACFTSLPALIRFDAVGAGPALGTRLPSRKALHHLLQTVKVPLILDADAINILALNREWLELVPENSVLTPHPGEFDRLIRQHNNCHERLISQIETARKFKIIMVLKGAYTSVVTPDGRCCFNSSGNPGMATPGSGDVLTGILLSLLGQGYQPADAAIAGVFLHGLAGDLASAASSQEAMLAGDISANLGKAFELIKNRL